MTVGGGGNKCHQPRSKMAPASSNCLAYAMGRRTPPAQPQLRQRGPTPPKLSSPREAVSPSSRSGSASPVSTASRSARPPGWIERHRAQVNSGLFLLCVALYWNSLAGDFVFDDVTAIRDNRDLRPHVPWRNLLHNDFWGTPMSKEQSHKSYRPVTVATFRLNYALGGPDPAGYHLVNVILHGAVTLLYHSLCARLLGGSGLTAVVASVLFAAHPIHTEAVTGVVGRAELLSSLFYLSALLSYARSSRRCASSIATNGIPDRRLTRWRPLLWSLLFAALAMFSKEQGVTVIAVCVAYEVAVAQRLASSDLARLLRSTGKRLSAEMEWLAPCLQRLCALAAAGLALVLWRMRVMGDRLPVFTRFDNPAAAAGAPARQLTFNYLAGVNAWLLLSPSDLCCDWTMDTVPLVRGFADPRNLCTLLTYAGFSALLWTALRRNNRLSVSPSSPASSPCLANNNNNVKENQLLALAPHPRRRSTQRESSVIVLSLALTVFPFVPASNLFFPVGFVVAERVLYLPSMGFSLLVAVGWNRLRRRLSLSKGSALLLLLPLLAAHSAKTVFRNAEWRDELTLFGSGLKVAPVGNAKLYNNVGHALESRKEFGRALDYFREATSVQPEDIGGHINVGRALNQLERFEEAEAAYLKAKSLLPRAKQGETYEARVAPNHLNVFLNLATLISKNGSRLEEADSLYRQAISMRSDYTQAYINRGDILVKMNRTEEARAVYETALSFEADNADLLYNMGVVLVNQKKVDQALSYLDRALEHDPDHPQALLTSAILIQESRVTGLSGVAVDRLRRMVEKGQANERVYFNLGMLAMDGGDRAEAERHLRTAVDLKPDFRSALFNLALLLSEIPNRGLESVPLLHQLLQHHPDHIKGLILLGDLYVNHLSDLDAAERCYKRILELDGENVQGLHNLCVVMVERGNLLDARECLAKARDLAPHERYIQDHLDIVEKKMEEVVEMRRRSEASEDP